MKVGDSVVLTYKTTSSSLASDRIYLNGLNTAWYNGSRKTITQEILNSTVILYGGYDEIATISEFLISKENGEYTPYNSIRFKVQNKNLFNPESKILNLTNIASYSYDNGIYTIIPKTSENVQFRMSLYLLPGSYVFNSSLVTASNIIIRNETSVIKTLSSYTNQTFTTTNKVDRILFNLNSPDGISPIILNLSDLQIEEGSTASDYVEHQEQTQIFTFEEGQYLAEGGYLADDGIHNIMGKLIIDGTENWTQYNNNVYFQDINKIHGKPTSGSIIGGFCNYTDTSTTTNIQYNSASAVGIFVRNLVSYWGLEEATVSEWETFVTNLYTQGKPLIIQYFLAEESITPYTPTQQAQWNAIKAMKTYKNVSHISTEGGTLEPSNDVVYYKDLETMFNNMTA